MHSGGQNTKGDKFTRCDDFVPTQISRRVPQQDKSLPAAARTSNNRRGEGSVALNKIHKHTLFFRSLSLRLALKK